MGADRARATFHSLPVSNPGGDHDGFHSNRLRPRSCGRDDYRDGAGEQVSEGLRQQRHHDLRLSVDAPSTGLWCAGVEVSFDGGDHVKACILRSSVCRSPRISGRCRSAGFGLPALGRASGFRPLRSERERFHASADGPTMPQRVQALHHISRQDMLCSGLPAGLLLPLNSRACLGLQSRDEVTTFSAHPVIEAAAPRSRLRALRE